MLAKPDRLSNVVGELVNTDAVIDAIPPSHGWELHIIGPQRASNLVYEVARQLGGTAVVVYIDPIDVLSACWNGEFDKMPDDRNGVIYE